MEDVDHAGPTGTPDDPVVALLLTLCSGIAGYVKPLGPRGGSVFCPTTNDYPRRGPEAAVAFAVAYRLTGERRYLTIARDMVWTAVDWQNADGSWGLGASPQSWRGATVFKLWNLSATYLELKDAFSTAEQEEIRQTIGRAAHWVAGIEPLTHLRHAAQSIINRLSGAARARATQRRYFPTNYIAAAPFALHYAFLATGDDSVLAPIGGFLQYVDRFINADLFFEGEVNEPKPAQKWLAAAQKLTRRGTGVDVAYGLDVSVPLAALYAKLTGDEARRERLSKSARAHLNFLYPDGELDNSFAARGYHGTPARHSIQLLEAAFGDLDSCFGRAARANAGLLLRCVADGVMHYAPEKSGRPDLPYAIGESGTVERATAAALMLRHLPQRQPTQNSKLLCEEDHGQVWFETLQTGVFRHRPFMGTVSAYRHNTSRLPYRFVAQPTGGALCMLYHDAYGFIYKSSPIYYERVESGTMPEWRDGGCTTPRVVLAGKDATSANDVRAKVTALATGFAVTGRLRRRWTAQPGNPFTLRYEVRDQTLAMAVTVDRLAARDTAVLVLPVVLNDNVTGYALDGGRLSIRTSRAELRLEVEVRSAKAEIRLAEPFVCLPMPVRALPLEIAMSGNESVACVVTTRVEANAGD